MAGVQNPSSPSLIASQFAQYDASLRGGAPTPPPPPNPIVAMPPAVTPGVAPVPVVPGAPVAPAAAAPAVPPSPPATEAPAAPVGDGEADPGISTLDEVAATFAGEDGNPLTFSDLGHMTHQIGDKDYSLQQIVDGFTSMPDAKAVLDQRYQLEAEFAGRNRQLDTDHASALDALSGITAQMQARVQRMEDPAQLAALAATDPAGYAERIQQIEADRLQVRSAEELTRNQNAKRAQDTKALGEQHLASEARHLAERFPEWSDPTTGPVLKSKVSQYAASIGFSPQELGNVTDHRLLLVLRDAAMGAQMKTTGAKVIKDAKQRNLNAPRTPQQARGDIPGKSQIEDKGRAAAFMNHARDQSIESAAEVFGALV